MNHYPAYICKNGHEISTLGDNCSDNFCKSCGAPIINKCPNCNSIIQGRSRGEYGYIATFFVPSYCPHCGKPYPWTIAALESVQIALELSDDIPDDKRERMIDLLPDIVSETPKTTLAVALLRQLLNAGGKFITHSLEQFVSSFGCELARQILGLTDK